MPPWPTEYFNHQRVLHLQESKKKLEEILLAPKGERGPDDSLSCLEVGKYLLAVAICSELTIFSGPPASRIGMPPGRCSPKNPQSNSHPNELYDSPHLDHCAATDVGRHDDANTHVEYLLYIQLHSKLVVPIHPGADNQRWRF